MQLFIFKPNIYLQALAQCSFTSFPPFSLPHYKHAICTLKYNIKQNASLNLVFFFFSLSLIICPRKLKLWRDAILPFYWLSAQFVFIVLTSFCLGTPWFASEAAALDVGSAINTTSSELCAPIIIFDYKYCSRSQT